MKSFRSILWGLVLIVVGVILGLNSFGITDIDIFFSGWWTLFIIIPCFIGIICEREKIGNIIGLIIGVYLLLWCQGIMKIEMLWKLITPIILILIGLSFIFKDIFNKKINKEIKKINDKSTDNNYTAIFSGQEIKLTDEKLEKVNLTSIFGGIDLDLRDAKITNDIVINACTIFGGADLFVPENVKVKIVSSSIFGGVEDKKRKIDEENQKYTLYINATCIFGGVDIK